MNIVQITASDTGIGGASRIVLDLHKAWKERGFSSTIFSGTNTSQDPDVIHVPKKKWMKVASRLCATDIDFFGTDRILDDPRFKAADIVHLHNIHGYWFNFDTFQKICAQKPVIWTLHDMWAITPHCAHSPYEDPQDGFFNCASLNDYPHILWNNTTYLKYRKRSVYESSTFTIVTPSLWLKTRVKKSVLGQKDIHLIYNGIDTDIFNIQDQQEARKKLGLPFDTHIALFVAAGGLSNEFKGGNHVTELAQKLPHLLFVVVGEKNNDIEKLHPNIKTFPGIKDKEELRDFYTSSSFLLFPSHAENFPLVVLESMACRCPVVAYDVGGVKEVIRHNINGYIAQTQDIQSLEKCIQDIVSLDTRGYNALCTQARHTVATTFSIKKMSEDYLNLYTSILENNDHH